MHDGLDENEDVLAEEGDDFDAEDDGSPEEGGGFEPRVIETPADEEDLEVSEDEESEDQPEDDFAEEEDDHEIDLDGFMMGHEAQVVATAKKAQSVVVPMPKSDRVTVVGMLVDDSGSIANRGLDQAVCDGLSLCMESFTGAHGCDFFLVVTGFKQDYFSGMLADFDLKQFRHQYVPDFNYTPLITKSLDLFGKVRRAAESFRAQGIQAKEAMLVLTDGLLEYDSTPTATFSKAISGSNCYIVGMGVYREDDRSDTVTLYGQLFREMGIKPENIKTPKATPKEIRGAMDEFSRSVSSVAAR